jgi:CDGSH-type Zn-finger protein
MFETTVHEIKEKSITVSQKGQILEIAADSVLALTGYHPDFDFIKKTGINIDSETLIPEFNQETGETNIPGIYIAGSLQAGRNANKIFIENGRLHGKIIADSIREKSGKRKETCEITCLNDGAYRVTGDFVIKDGKGEDFDLSGRKTISLCRCGEAKNKPFCDGAHKEFFKSKVEARKLPPPVTK